MDQAKKAKIETLLRQELSFLSSFPEGLKRNHILEKVACKKCGVVSIQVVRRCGYKLCRHCARGYHPLVRLLRSLEVVPANLLTIVLPYRSMPLHELRRGDAFELRKVFVKFRDQAFFRKSVEAGHIFIEMSINESLQAFLHLHLFAQTFAPVHAKPLNILQASAHWKALTGMQMEKPQPLRKFVTQEAHKAFGYTVKQMKGEQTIPILRDLASYVEETEGKYCERAKKLRTFILQRYNSVFYGVHKRGFFGKWYTKAKPTVTQAKPTVTHGEYRCHCGLGAPFVSVPQ